MSNILAAIALFAKIGEMLQKFFLLKGDIKIENAIKSPEQEIESVVNSQSAGKRSRHTGRAGLFEFPADKN